MSATNGHASGNIDLVKKHGVDAWANISRSKILLNIAQAACLTEKVYWALILTSWCGPQVREECYLRNQHGYIVLDEHEQPIPLRPKHLLQMLRLDSGSRANVKHSLDKLVRQKRLEIADGRWRPVFNPPADPATETVSQDVVSTDNKAAYTFRLLRFELDLSRISDPVVRTATWTQLNSIKDRLNTTITEARNHAKDEVEQLLLAVPSLYEKPEEIDEIEPSSSSRSSPELTTTTVGVSVAVQESKQTATAPASITPILEAFERKGCAIDVPRARKLFQECRQSAPDVTPDEVAGVAQEVHIGRTLTNPVGFLLKAVQNGCHPDSLVRRRMRQQQQESTSRAEQIAAWRRIRDDPNEDPDIRQRAVDVLQDLEKSP
jgi:hypothetical protein